MKSYLKLIVNAACAGAYGALLMALLLVFLNDDLAASGVLSASFARAVASCLLIYLPLIALVLPSLFMIMRFFAARHLTARWLYLKAVVWLGCATLGVVTLVYYHNLRWAAGLMPPGAREALRTGSAFMAGSFLLAVGAAITGQLRAGEAGRNWRSLAAAVLIAPPALMLLILPRPPASGRAAGRQVEAPLAAVASGGGGAGRGLLLVGIEAASMDQILPMVSARSLPTMERLIHEGAAARLDSIRPCESRVAWTVLVTGMPPWSNGVLGDTSFTLPAGPSDIDVLPRAAGLFTLTRLGLIGASPAGAAQRRAPSVWEIARAAGYRTRAIGWPEMGAAAPAATLAAGISAKTASSLEEILGSGSPPSVPDASARIAILRTAITMDLSAQAAALNAAGEPAETVLAVRYPGLGLVARQFLRYHVPTEFGDVKPDEVAAFSRVIPGYYEFLDGLLRELLEAAGSGRFVMIVSAHGIEPESARARLLRLIGSAAAVEPAPSGSWLAGPDGVLILDGEGLVQEMRVEEVDLLDVVPTALYALGLPIGRDMRGDLLRRLFRHEFLESHPVHFIPGYGGPPGRL